MYIYLYKIYMYIIIYIYIYIYIMNVANFCCFSANRIISAFNVKGDWKLVLQASF